jgi:glutamine synthetase
MSKTVKDVVKMGQEGKRVDLRFTDLPGTWQHLSILAQLRDELWIDVADVRHWGPEAEFFLFNDARYRILANC